MENQKIEQTKKDPILKRLVRSTAARIIGIIILILLAIVGAVALKL